MKKKKIEFGKYVGNFFYLIAFVTIALILGYFLYSPQRGDAFVSDTQYSIQSISFENDEIINDVVKLCSFTNRTINKVGCTFDFYNDMFQYRLRNTTFDLYSPKEIIENNGGLCRDFAVIFKLTMDKMDINNNYIHIPNHVFNIVYIDEKYVAYCIIDLAAEQYWCV